MTRCPIDRSPLYSEFGDIKCLAAGHGPQHWARIGVEAPSTAVSAPPAPAPCPTCGGQQKYTTTGYPYCPQCYAKRGGPKPGSLVWNRGTQPMVRAKSETMGVY